MNQLKPTGSARGLRSAPTIFLRVLPECRNHAHVLKHPSTRKCPLTGDVIRSFNRDTAWLPTGVLGALVLAALMLAVEDHESKVMHAGPDFLVNANLATMASVSPNSNGKTDTSPIRSSFQTDGIRSFDSDSRSGLRSSRKS